MHDGIQALDSQIQIIPDNDRSTDKMMLCHMCTGSIVSKPDQEMALSSIHGSNYGPIISSKNRYVSNTSNFGRVFMCHRVKSIRSSVDVINRLINGCIRNKLNGTKQSIKMAVTPTANTI